jgi:hypothetical protein
MLEGVVIDGTEQFNDRLQEWEDSTTTTVRMADSGVRRCTRGSDRRPSARCERTSSVAHSRGHVIIVFRVMLDVPASTDV